MVVTGQKPSASLRIRLPIGHASQEKVTCRWFRIYISKYFVQEETIDTSKKTFWLNLCQVSQVLIHDETTFFWDKLCILLDLLTLDVWRVFFSNSGSITFNHDDFCKLLGRQCHSFPTLDIRYHSVWNKTSTYEFDVALGCMGNVAGIWNFRHRRWPPLSPLCQGAFVWQNFLWWKRLESWGSCGCWGGNSFWNRFHQNDRHVIT